MTSTERIAVALRGWISLRTQYNSRGRLYSRNPEHKKSTYDFEVRVDPKTGEREFGSSDWPDFNTLDGCREFEDALRDLGHGLQYRQALWLVRNRETGLPVDLTNIDPHTAMNCGIFSTPEQRVAACIMVMNQFMIGKDLS